MISVGFRLTAKELRKLEEFKYSVAYGTYIKNIKNSPVYLSIMKEHADQVNIDSDIARLKAEGQLPDNISSDSLTSLFKQSIARMVINIVADAVILKELEDKSIDDVINDVKEDVNILYLTGMAESKYYKEAQKMLEDGKLSKNDVAYRGLMAWMKRQDNTPQVELPTRKEKPKPTITPRKSHKASLDLDSLNIDLGD